MDAEELGILCSVLAGGRDWSSIKHRGAVICVLLRLQGAGERGNHPANPLPSEPEHLQGWDGKDVANLPCPTNPLFSECHLWHLEAPQEIRQSWKSLRLLRYLSREATYLVPRLERGCSSWNSREDAVGLVGHLPLCHHPGESGRPGCLSNQLRAMHCAQYGLILQRVSLLGCTVPGARRS